MADEPPLEDFVGGLRKEFVDWARASALRRPDAGAPEAAASEAAASEADPDEGEAEAVVQEPTLDEARAKGLKLKRTLVGVMDPWTMYHQSSAWRRHWYIHELGRYQNQLRESSTRHDVPVQLLAAVILNELADIGISDAFQYGVLTGSLGIAQIEVDTVIRDDLFPDMNTDEIREAAVEFADTAGFPLLLYHDMDPQEIGLRAAIANRLWTPQHAIDACAREVRILLYLMAASVDKPWQTFFGFTWRGGRLSDPQAIYEELEGRVYCESPEEIEQREKTGKDFMELVGNEGNDPRREKEKNLAYLTAAAYNDPDITSADNVSGKTAFPGSRRHGANACRIAGDLYDFGLFRP